MAPIHVQPRSPFTSGGTLRRLLGLFNAPVFHSFPAATLPRPGPETRSGHPLALLHHQQFPHSRRKKNTLWHSTNKDRSHQRNSIVASVRFPYSGFRVNRSWKFVRRYQLQADKKTVILSNSGRVQAGRIQTQVSFCPPLGLRWPRLEHRNQIPFSIDVTTITIQFSVISHLPPTITCRQPVSGDLPFSKINGTGLPRAPWNYQFVTTHDLAPPILWLPITK